MRLLAGIVLLLAGLMPEAVAETWVEVGADPEAKYYVDVDSTTLVRENLRITKRGVYTRVLTENPGGKPTVFKETRGIIELDCALRVNRVIRIDMLDPEGERWLLAEHEPVKVDVSQWNEFTIIARGNHIVHKVNGEVTSELIDHLNLDGRIARGERLRSGVEGAARRLDG